jgi:exodeoxyribonuclease III
MLLASWNVNGIRSARAKGLLEFMRDFGADVYCLQEVRATREQAGVELPGYAAHFYPAQKPGYSGTAIFSRVPLVRVTEGIGIEEHDREGRVLTAELDGFFLVNVYTPNSQRGLARLDYRVGQWDPAFRAYLKKLARKKPVVFCGDLNVAHEELDIANPRGNRRNAGFTDAERASFGEHLKAGFVDTFRELCKEGGRYTWWSNFGRAREKNVGWRIDYFCMSRSLRPRLEAAKIHPEVRGSDHCPISLRIS